MNQPSEQELPVSTSNQESFLRDVLRGLYSEPKFLQSKYFYDAEGDKLFQKIMRLPEYYLTGCESEILRNNCPGIAGVFKRFASGFDLIELGAGDASKSSILLEYLLNEGIDFTYYPTDISEHVVKLVEKNLPHKFPYLKVRGLTGEFLAALSEASCISQKPKVVMFLGSNIGNMPPHDALEFCKNVKNHLETGDLALIGFDLKKNPRVIFDAYNDSQGITKKFNLNLLDRINRELQANFLTEKFDHYESYDPETGACKSYLFSLKKQSVSIAGVELSFNENEYIYMETSHKYTTDQINELSLKAGFKPVAQFFDSKNWFTDVVWERL